MNLPITNSQIDQIFESLDRNKDGFIDIYELEQIEQGASLRHRMLISRLLMEVSKAFDSSFKDIQVAYQFFDTNGTH